MYQAGKNGPSLLVDGETVEIVPARGMANRRHLRIPSLDAVVGGVLIFAGVHMWVGDTPTRNVRAAWIAEPDRIAARKPAIVVPGLEAEGALDIGAKVATGEMTWG